MKTIALVEDNPDNRLLVRTLLEDQYHVVEFAAAGPALAAMREVRPDLLLLDISLPGMPGTELLAGVRAEPALADLPVVCLTAHAMVGDRERFLAAGFDGYVAKPILDAEELNRELRRHLETR